MNYKANDADKHTAIKAGQASRAEKLEALRAQLDSMQRRHQQREQRQRAKLSGVAHISATSTYFDENGKVNKSTSRMSSFEAPKKLHSIVWTSDAGDSGTFTVPKAVARAFGSGEHSFIDVDELDEFIHTLMQEAGWTRLVSLLNGRDRTRKELIDRLESEGFDSSISHAMVKKAQACGMVDESRYAEVFIATSIRKGWGRDKIERTLRERGIDPSAVQEYPHAFFAEDDEFERAVGVLSKKRVPETNPKQKLVRFLIGRGFSMSIAIRAVEERLKS